MCAWMRGNICKNAFEWPPDRKALYVNAVRWPLTPLTRVKDWPRWRLAGRGRYRSTTSCIGRLTRPLRSDWSPRPSSKCVWEGTGHRVVDDGRNSIGLMYCCRCFTQLYQTILHEIYCLQLVLCIFIVFFIILRIFYPLFFHCCWAVATDRFTLPGINKDASNRI